MSDSLDMETFTGLVVSSESSIDLSRNPAAIYLKELQPSGRKSQESALRKIIELAKPGSTLVDFPWAKLTYAHVQAIRSKLAESYSPATANRMMVALRRVLYEAVMIGQMDGEEYRKIQSIKHINGSRLSVGKSLSKEEVATAISSTSEGSTPERDAAIIALLHGSGLRLSELASLDLSSYDGVRVKVIGKGNKQRQVPLSQGAIRCLSVWIEKRGRWPGPLFVRAYKGGSLGTGRLSDDSIAKIVKEYAMANPHDFRRTFATTLLQNGVDIGVVADLMGHESVDTTRIYNKKADVAMEKAVATLETPTNE